MSQDNQDNQNRPPNPFKQKTTTNFSSLFQANETRNSTGAGSVSNMSNNGNLDNQENLKNQGNQPKVESRVNSMFSTSSQQIPQPKNIFERTIVPKPVHTQSINVSTIPSIQPNIPINKQNNKSNNIMPLLQLQQRPIALNPSTINLTIKTSLTSSLTGQKIVCTAQTNLNLKNAPISIQTNINRINRPNIDSQSKTNLINKSTCSKILQSYNILTNNGALLQQNLATITDQAIKNRLIQGYGFYTHKLALVSRQQLQRFYAYMIDKKPYQKLLDMLIRNFNDMNPVCAVYVLNNTIAGQTKGVEVAIKNIDKLVTMGKNGSGENEALNQQLEINPKVQNLYHAKHLFYYFYLNDKLNLLKIYETNMKQFNDFVPNSQRSLSSTYYKKQKHHYFQQFFNLQAYDAYLFQPSNLLQSNNCSQSIMILNETLKKIVSLVKMFYESGSENDKMTNESNVNYVFSECIKFLESISKKFYKYKELVNIEQLKSKLLEIKIKELLNGYLHEIKALQSSQPINKHANRIQPHHHINFKQYGSWEYLLTYLFNNFQETDYKQKSNQTIQFLYLVLQKMSIIEQLQACQQWLTLIKKKIQLFTKRMKGTSSNSKSINYKIQILQMFIIIRCIQKLKFHKTAAQNKQKNLVQFTQMTFQNHVSSFENNERREYKIKQEIGEIFNGMFRCAVQKRRLLYPRILFVIWLSFAQNSKLEPTLKSSGDGKSIDLNLQTKSLLSLLNIFSIQNVQNQNQWHKYLTKTQNQQAKSILALASTSSSLPLSLQYDPLFAHCISPYLTKLNSNPNKKYSIHFRLKQLIVKSLQKVFQKLKNDNDLVKYHQEQRRKNLQGIVNELCKTGTKNCVKLSLENMYRVYNSGRQSQASRSSRGSVRSSNQQQGQQQDQLVANKSSKTKFQKRLQLFNQFNTKFLQKITKILYSSSSVQLNSSISHQENLQLSIKQLLINIYSNFTIFSVQYNQRQAIEVEYDIQCLLKELEREIKFCKREHNFQKANDVYNNVMEYEIEIFGKLNDLSQQNLIQKLNSSHPSDQINLIKCILQYIQNLQRFYPITSQKQILNKSHTELKFLHVDIKIILLERFLKMIFNHNQQGNERIHKGLDQQKLFDQFRVCLDMLIKVFREFILPRIQQYMIFKSKTISSYRFNIFLSFQSLLNLINQHIIQQYDVQKTVQFLLSPSNNINKNQAIQQKVETFVAILVEYERQRELAEQLLEKRREVSSSSNQILSQISQMSKNNTRNYLRIESSQNSDRTHRLQPIFESYQDQKQGQEIVENINRPASFLPNFPFNIIKSIKTSFFAQNFPSFLITQLNQQIAKSQNHRQQISSRLQSYSVYSPALTEFKFSYLSTNTKNFYSNISSWIYFMGYNLIKHYYGKSSQASIQVKSVKFLQKLNKQTFLYFWQRMTFRNMNLKDIVSKKLQYDQQERQRQMRMKNKNYQGTKNKFEQNLKKEIKDNLKDNKDGFRFGYFLYLETIMEEGLVRLEERLNSQQAQKQSNNPVRAVKLICQLKHVLNMLLQYRMLIIYLQRNQFFIKDNLKTKEMRQNFEQQTRTLIFKYINSLLSVLPSSISSSDYEFVQYKNLLISSLLLIVQHKDYLGNGIDMKNTQRIFELFQQMQLSEIVTRKMFQNQFLGLNKYRSDSGTYELQFDYEYLLGAYINKQELSASILQLLMPLMDAYMFRKCHSYERIVKKFQEEYYERKRRNRGDSRLMIKVGEYENLGQCLGLVSKVVGCLVERKEEGKEVTTGLQFTINIQKQVIRSLIFNLAKIIDYIYFDLIQYLSYKNTKYVNDQTRKQAIHQKLLHQQSINPKNPICKQYRQILQQKWPQKQQYQTKHLLNTQILDFTKTVIELCQSVYGQEKKFQLLQLYVNETINQAQNRLFEWKEDFFEKRRRVQSETECIRKFYSSSSDNTEVQITEDFAQNVYRSMVYYGNSLDQRLKCQNFYDFGYKLRQFMLGIFFMPQITIEMPFQNNKSSDHPIELIHFNEIVHFLQKFKTFLQKNSQYSIYYEDLFMIDQQQNFHTIKRQFYYMFKNLQIYQEIKQYSIEIENRGWGKESKRIIEIVKIASMKYIILVMEVFGLLIGRMKMQKKDSFEYMDKKVNSQKRKHIESNMDQHTKFFIHSLILRIILSSGIIDQLQIPKAIPFNIQNPQHHSSTKPLVRPFQTKLFLINLLSFLNTIFSRKFLLSASIQLPLQQIYYRDYIFDTGTTKYHQTSLISCLVEEVWQKSKNVLKNSKVKQCGVGQKSYYHKVSNDTNGYSSPFLDKDIDLFGCEREAAALTVKMNIHNNKYKQYYSPNDQRNTVIYTFFEYLQQVLNLELYNQFVRHVCVMKRNTLSQFTLQSIERIFVTEKLAIEAFSHIKLAYDTMKAKKKEQRKQENVKNLDSVMQKDFQNVMTKLKRFTYTGFANLDLSLYQFYRLQSFGSAKPKKTFYSSSTPSQAFNPTLCINSICQSIAHSLQNQKLNRIFVSAFQKSNNSNENLNLNVYDQITMYYSFSDIENGNGSNNRGGGIMMRNSKRAMNRLSSVG